MISLIAFACAVSLSYPMRMYLAFASAILDSLRITFRRGSRLSNLLNLITCYSKKKGPEGPDGLLGFSADQLNRCLALLDYLGDVERGILRLLARFDHSV